MYLKRKILSKRLLDSFCDTVELCLSIIFGVLLGCNFKVVLDLYFSFINFFSDSYVVMVIGIWGIAVFSEFIVNTVPIYIAEALYKYLSNIKINRMINISAKLMINLLLFLVRIFNYVCMFFLILFMIIVVARYGKEEPFIANNLNTYKISDSIINQIISSDYMQFFIKRNETYNGMSMKEAMEINSEIELEALKISESGKTDLDKVRLIYFWVGTNIEYDDCLAENVKNKKEENTAGAKYAYYNRSGVCFEFATLFAAMIDSIDLSVKVIVGEAYNGEYFGAHAWNEVFLKDEDRWISVDPTFWGLNSSFDSKDFDTIHINRKVAWEN